MMKKISLSIRFLNSAIEEVDLAPSWAGKKYVLDLLAEVKKNR